MFFDPVTEKIAHFIGAFQMIEEQARLRAEYDEFRAIQVSQDRAETFELFTSPLNHGYKLKEFSPELKWKPIAGVAAAPDLAPSFSPLPPADFAENATAASYTPPILPYGPSSDDAALSSVGFSFLLPLPSSVATVTYQTATLFDNDIFGKIAAHGFQDIAPLTPLLQHLATIAEGLSPFNLDVTLLDGDLFDLVADIQAVAESMTPPSVDGFQVSLFQGENADGLYLNGEKTAVFPEWEDIIPAYHANALAQERAALDEETGSAEAQHDYERDFQSDADSPFKVADGHQVVAGANVLINSAAITSSWLDASVFAVGGDVLRFDAISQVNILIDHDFGFETMGIGDGGADPGQALNAASLSTLTVEEATTAAADETAEPELVDDGEEPEDAEQAPEKMLPAAMTGPSPENWVVERLEGDVVQMNWVKQYSFSTDFDQAAIAFQGASSFIGLGENLISNNFSTFQLGYNYDLIVVGGDMIDVNLISQRNIVLDSDTGQFNSDLHKTPATSALPEAVDDGVRGVAREGEARSVEDAVAMDAAQGGVPAPASLDAGGGGDEPGVNQNGPDEPNVPAAAAPDPEAAPPDGSIPAPPINDPNAPPIAEEQPVSPSGDNLLYNKATIEKAGFDKDAEIKQNFEDAIEAFSAGAEDVSAEIVGDSLFNGTELLRVLYIDGDFKTVNAVDQTNILGDADQVHLAVDEFALALQQEIELVAGSNIAANFAAIRDAGMDSEVMAQGDTYSDALIHQANLIDTGTAPPGAAIAALATEAVAFLADDIIDQSLTDDILAQTASMVAQAPDATDIMQDLVI